MRPLSSSKSFCTEGSCAYEHNAFWTTCQESATAPRGFSRPDFSAVSSSIRLPQIPKGIRQSSSPCPNYRVPPVSPDCTRQNHCHPACHARTRLCPGHLAPVIPNFQLCPIDSNSLLLLNTVSSKCKSKLQWGTTSHRSEWPSPKSLQIINAGQGVDKREPSYTVGGNVNWCSHYGEQYGGSFKNWKQSCHIIQQSHSWAYIPKRRKF